MEHLLAPAIALVAPLLAALMVLASEALTAPAHGEHRDHRRDPTSRMVPIERTAGCLVGALVAGLLLACLVYLWETRPPW